MQATNNLEKYRDRMFRPTSRNDLNYMLDNKVKILTYDQLDNYTSFDELMNPYHALIILYPNADDPEVGHWCCCYIMQGVDNRVEYFDSYGAYIDEPVGEYNKGIRSPRKIEPKLLDLIKDSPYADRIWWNEIPFQSESEATATCGLWCVARLKNTHLTEEGFATLYFDLPVKQKVLPDLLVAGVICNLYPEKA
jgi:hypothetical protein